MAAYRPPPPPGNVDCGQSDTAPAGIHGSHVGVYFQKMRFIMLLNVVLTALWVQ